MAVQKQSIKVQAGPNPYAGGGFTVTFGEFQKVVAAVVTCSKAQVLEVADTAYSVETSFATNIVTIKVFAASTVGAGPNAWAELAAGNMSGLNFTVVAVGE